ncbi:hypothetical protein ACN47E_000331 [Coniothyrium glycines]
MSTIPRALLPSFSAAVTPAAAAAAPSTFPPSYITEHILALSTYLTSLAEHSNLFGAASHDPFSPSLRTLHERLESGFLPPSPLPTQFLSDAHVQASSVAGAVAAPLVERDLADFADVFCALLARLQEIRTLLNLRLHSGFNAVTDAVFDNGPSIADLHESLSSYWTVLNDASCGRAMDDAVRRARAVALQTEIVRQVQSNEISAEDAEGQIAQIWSEEVYGSIQGLDWTVEWAPVLVGAKLEEKYRAVLGWVQRETERKGRLERRRARMGKKQKVTFLDESGNGGGGEVQQDGRAGREGERLVDQGKQVGLDNGEIRKAPAREQYPVMLQQDHAQETARHDLMQHRARQDQLQHDMEWQYKTQRVSEYSQYLRGRASQDAQYLVNQTFSGGTLSAFGSPGVREGEASTDMEF